MHVENVYCREVSFPVISPAFTLPCTLTRDHLLSLARTCLALTMRSPNNKLSLQHVPAFLRPLLEQNDRVDDRGYDESQPDRDEYCEPAWGGFHPLLDGVSGNVVGDRESGPR